MNFARHFAQPPEETVEGVETREVCSSRRRTRDTWSLYLYDSGGSKLPQPHCPRGTAVKPSIEGSTSDRQASWNF